MNLNPVDILVISCTRDSLSYCCICIMFVRRWDGVILHRNVWAGLRLPLKTPWNGKGEYPGAQLFIALSVVSN
jgi:hypothetical protein